MKWDSAETERVVSKEWRGSKQDAQSGSTAICKNPHCSSSDELENGIFHAEALLSPRDSIATFPISPSSGDSENTELRMVSLTGTGKWYRGGAVGSE